MANWRKRLIIGSSICIGCFLAVVLCINYPAVDLYLKSLGPAAFGADAGSNGESFLSNEEDSQNEALPSPVPSQIPVNQGAVSYITPGMHGGDFKYTLHDVKIYESIEATDISASECTPHFSEDTSLQKGKFMVYDMTVENLGERPGIYDDLEFPFVLDLWVMYKDIDISQGVPAYECYFSQHPPQSPASTNYYHFALEPGDKMDFQYGVSVPDELLEKQGFVLCLGSYKDEQYFNPFDQKFTGVVVP